MPRLQHAVSGVTVSVGDDHPALNDSEWVAVGSGADSAQGYSAQKVDELKAEIDRRNEGREEADLISSDGKKADLIAALEADDSK